MCTTSVSCSVGGSFTYRNKEGKHDCLKVPSLNSGAVAVPRQPKNSGAAAASVQHLVGFGLLRFLVP